MQPREVLQGVHNSITNMVKEVANEPSVGLYFVQQHVHKAVPGLISLKGQLVEGTQEALLYTEDVKDALASVKTMKEVGPPVVNKMIASLNTSLQLLPTLHHPKVSSRPPAAYPHLLRSATHHGAPTSGLKLEVKGTTGRKSSNQEPAVSLPKPQGPTEALPPRSPRSSSSQANEKLLSSTQTDSSGYVSSFLNSAYQRASSGRISMPNTQDRVPVPKSNSVSNVPDPPNLTTSQIPTSDSNAGHISNKSYWNVFESALQKAGHMVGAGSISSGSLSDSSLEPTLLRSFSATTSQESPHKTPTGQLQDVLDSADFRAGSAVQKEGNTPRSDGNKQAHESQERSFPDSIESQVKLADWLKLPSTALRKLSRRDGSDSFHGNGDELNLQGLREREGLEEGDTEENTPGLDLENPQVLESYAKLQAEQAAKLEAWLGDAKEDESTPAS